LRSLQRWPTRSRSAFSPTTEAASKTLAVALDGRHIEDAEGDTTRDRFLLLVNAHHEPVDFTAPAGVVVPGGSS